MPSALEDFVSNQVKSGEFDDAAILEAVKDSPFAARIPDVLREAHRMLYREPAKRQSES